jgi:hypothetical protein
VALQGWWSFSNFAAGRVALQCTFSMSGRALNQSLCIHVLVCKLPSYSNCCLFFSHGALLLS